MNTAKSRAKRVRVPHRAWNSVLVAALVAAPVASAQTAPKPAAGEAALGSGGAASGGAASGGAASGGAASGGATSGGATSGGAASGGAASGGAASGGATSSTPNRLDLSTVYAEDPLIVWKVGAGPSFTTISFEGDWKTTRGGIAFRLGVGPLITPELAALVEVGARTYARATYLDFALTPTGQIGLGKGWIFTVAPIVGLTLADVSLADSEKGLPYPRRFQVLAGAEAGFWFPLKRSPEASYVERILDPMAHLADDYRDQCPSAEKQDTPECQSIAHRLVLLRGLLSEGGNVDSCALPDKIDGDDPAKPRIDANTLDQIDVCRILARERRNHSPNLARIGFAPRVTYSGGRELPAAFVAELGVFLLY